MARIASLALALVVLPACPLLDVEADVQDACATYHNVAVPAVPVVQGSMSQSFTVDNLDALKQLAQLNASLTFTHGRVHATSGISDFSFVSDVTVTVASGDPSSTLPTLTPFGCQDCGTATATIDVASDEAIDANDYVTSGSLIVTVDLAGQPPSVAWTMDVDVCMSGKASYTYSP